MATPEAIAKSKIRKPGNRPKRILVYGRNKLGKTRFAGTAPNVLIVDPEGGADGTLTTQDIWPVENWKDFNDLFKYLKTSSAKAKYDWVAIDGLTRISNMSLRFVMKHQEERDLDRIPGAVQQRDYGRSGEIMKGLMFNFHTLPYGIVYTAQDRMETGGTFDSEDDEVEEAAARFVPDLPKGVRSTVNGLVDVIGRIYGVPVEGVNSAGKEVSGLQRRLWLAPSDQYDTGFRTSLKGIPPFLKNPTVPRLADLLDGTTTKG